MIRISCICNLGNTGNTGLEPQENNSFLPPFAIRSNREYLVPVVRNATSFFPIAFFTLFSSLLNGLSSKFLSFLHTTSTALIGIVHLSGLLIVRRLFVDPTDDEVVFLLLLLSFLPSCLLPLPRRGFLSWWLFSIRGRTE